MRSRPNQNGDAAAGIARQRQLHMLQQPLRLAGTRRCGVIGRQAQQIDLHCLRGTVSLRSGVKRLRRHRRRIADSTGAYVLLLRHELFKAVIDPIDDTGSGAKVHR